MLEQGLWHCHEGADAELELHKLLYSFIYMLKPQLVVETGTFKGYGTLFLARAVMANDFGHVITCDPNYPNPFEPHTPEYEHITFKQQDSLTLPEMRTADFVWSDSHHDIRPVEYALVKPGCVFVVHDTDQPYYGNPPFLGEWVREMGGLLFHAGRGFGLLVK